MTCFGVSFGYKLFESVYIANSMDCDKMGIMFAKYQGTSV